MAQLGDLVRAKALVRSAARAFGAKEALARARCVVAEAEIALASRDLNWPVKALDTARTTLQTHGDWVNAAHARYLEIRRLLLIGHLDEAEGRLAELDPTPLLPASRAAYELVLAGIAMRRLQTKAARAALERAGHAAQHAGIAALTAEVESARHILDTPAARLIIGGQDSRCCSMRLKRYWHPPRWWWTLAGMWCATQTRRFRSPGVRCCSRSPGRWAKRGRPTCRGKR
ncbi:hypothetical protein SRABI130_04892 [Pseudomonas sp. Bi130]|nr:hypothetical protein SRABI130_04892 [Pseudomonas sp. Bi130]